jgi:hypothetical protein
MRTQSEPSERHGIGHTVREGWDVAVLGLNDAVHAAGQFALGGGGRRRFDSRVRVSPSPYFPPPSQIRKSVNPACFRAIRPSGRPQTSPRPP